MKRFKPRYLALRIESNKIACSTELMSAMFTSLLRLYGEYGASKTRIALISYDPEKRFAVVRTSHKSIDMVRTSLASITKIGETSAAIHVLKVSGTKKALNKNIDN